jgi:peptide/nickel transport system substrate-binding protein
MLRSPGKFITMTATLLALLLLSAWVVACGGASQEAAPAPQQPAAPPAATEIPAATPVAAPAATVAPEISDAMDERPTGTLTVGQKELGPFMGHPSLTGNPQIFLLQTAPIGESLLTVSSELKPVGMLAKSWSVSEDGSTWTFNLNEGVQFHKGYGEMTAEDVIWAMRAFGAEGSKHPRASNMRGIWENPDGHAKAIDDYTVEVNTGEPWSEVPVNEILTSAGGGGTWIVSKKQSDELGVEEANDQIAGTGSWDLVEYRTGEFWRMEAVENHWRKTPHFAELVFREIPEESSRIAGFQTGNLDTMQMALDSKPVIDQVPDVKYMRVEFGGTLQVALGLGNFHIPDSNRPSWDPDLPWVSASADVNSEEWDRARKVRLAMAIAIDKQTIVDTLLQGIGKPLAAWGWEANTHRLPDDMQEREYNPEKARQLLAEAGYPDGFEITLTPDIRGIPSEVEACEAVAVMWEEIGIRTRVNRVPYATVAPVYRAREYTGANCHGTAGVSDPMGLVGSVFLSDGPGIIGFEHPYLDEELARAIHIVDTEERYKLAVEVARFIWDNVVHEALYSVDILWPLSAKVQDWGQHLEHGDRRYLTGTEYAKHR